MAFPVGTVAKNDPRTDRRFAMGEAIAGLGFRMLGVLVLVLAFVLVHLFAIAGSPLSPTPVSASPSDAQVLLIALGGFLIVGLFLAIGDAGVLSDRRHADAKARDMARLRRLASATFEGVVIHEDGVVLDVNDNLATLLGARPEDVIGTAVSNWVAPEYREIAAAAASRGEDTSLELELLCANGTKRAVEVNGRNVILEGKAVRVAAVRDIVERREAERQILHLAHHDGSDRASQPEPVSGPSWSGPGPGATRDGEIVAVHILGIDHFKEVNNLYGHKAGDGLLCVVARLLEQEIRESDTVARIGGDVFAVVQVGIDSPRAAAFLATGSCRCWRHPVMSKATVSPPAPASASRSFLRTATVPKTCSCKSEKALYRAQGGGSGQVPALRARDGPPTCGRAALWKGTCATRSGTIG